MQKQGGHATSASHIDNFLPLLWIPTDRLLHLRMRRRPLNLFRRISVESVDGSWMNGMDLNGEIDGLPNRAITNPHSALLLCRLCGGRR